MRYIVLTTVLAFTGGLFMAGLALGAGETHSGKSQWGSSSQMEKEHQQQQYGTSSQEGQQQQRYGSSSQSGQQQRMAGQQLEKEKVRELQKKLNDEGFAAGPVDGIVGPKTRGAIENFQRQEGIAATGQPDQQTLEALDIEQEEFFGVSPEFGEEKQQKRSEEQQQMQQERQQEPFQQERQQGSGTMENR